jgi:hypothetical protein
MHGMRRTTVIILSALGAIVSALTIWAQQGQAQLALVDRAGTIERLGPLPRGTFAPRLSPDGRQVAFDTGDGTIWIAELAQLGSARRFGAGRFPMWSADGKRLLFAGSDAVRLYWQWSDGSGSPELIADDARAPESWSDAAGIVTFITLKGAGDYDIWAFSPADRKPRPLVEVPTSAQMSSRLSADGKWIAYEANETGVYEVYIEPLPRTGQRTRVTTRGGQRPVWSPDGGELFYDWQNTLYVVSVQTTPKVQIGTPSRLPITGFIQGFGRRLWDLTPDGKRFLVMLP